MYKLYTGIINQFIDEHCSSNSIIKVEQAGGKRGRWGCNEQLLINKMIVNEVREHKRNIFTMWFDYKKAFDSIPHQWLLEALKQAKLPADLIKCIETLAKKWATNITPHTEKERLVSSLIRYLTGILRGDFMSLCSVCVMCESTMIFIKQGLGWVHDSSQPT